MSSVKWTRAPDGVYHTTVGGKVYTVENAATHDINGKVITRSTSPMGFTARRGGRASGGKGRGWRFKEGQKVLEYVPTLDSAKVAARHYFLAIGAIDRQFGASVAAWGDWRRTSPGNYTHLASTGDRVTGTHSATIKKDKDGEWVFCARRKADKKAVMRIVAPTLAVAKGYWSDLRRIVM